jgi:ATP-binding cassette subfamily F protein 3
MIRLLLEPVNLLILDEPTNHLDLASKDVLKKAILEFDGTAIIVSHDRDFLDGLVNKVYEFGGGKVLEHIGGIYDYLSKKKLDSLQQLEITNSASKAAAQSKAAQTKIETGVSSKTTTDLPVSKLSYQQQKELNSKIRKVERQIEDIEKKIESHENEISVMETYLATPEGASDMDYLQKYVEVKAKLDKVMNKWERMTLELEKLQENR